MIAVLLSFLFVFLVLFRVPVIIVLFVFFLEPLEYASSSFQSKLLLPVFAAGLI